MSDPLDGKSYMLQMADEISRLRAELAAARAALEPFALRECKWGSKVYKINVTMDPQWIANARAVLAKEGKDE